MHTPIRLAPVPLPLRWHGPPPQHAVRDDGVLSITAPAGTDLFIDPRGTGARRNAPCLLAPVAGDFLFSARVTVDFASSFDAGVLLLYASGAVWAKLCFEYSPDREPMIVSVVTRDRSDDANSFVVDGHGVWLRIARHGQAYAFHASTDGARWRLVRHFSLDGADAAVGFLAQSPTGDGCNVTFDDLGFARARLRDIRSGA